MQTFAQARTHSVRPCVYSTMLLPALSINERHAKHAPRGFTLRPAPCKTRMRAPAATDVRSCAAVLLRLLHYFLLCSLFIALFALFLAPWFPPYEKRQGQMPWRVANPVDNDTVDDAPNRVQGLVQCPASHLQEHYNCIAFLKSKI